MADLDEADVVAFPRPGLAIDEAAQAAKATCEAATRLIEAIRTQGIETSITVQSTGYGWALVVNAKVKGQ